MQWHLTCYVSESYFINSLSQQHVKEEIMRRYNFFSGFLILILFLLPSISSAQVFSDTVTVDLQLFLTDVDILFLNDLNLTKMQQAPLLFSVTIQNYFSIEKQLVLHFGIRRGNQILLDGTSEPFIIQAYPAQLYLTSQNLLSKGEQYSIKNYNIGDATDELANAILAQGKLPNGVYQFFIEVNYESSDNSQRLVFDEEILNIDFSTTLDLISPGQSAESEQLREIYTTLPFFQWHSTAKKFRITVCEKLAINNSPQDVMNNEPRMQQIVENFPFFQYPASGVWPLEEGKTYYWQIVAITESSSGPVELESEIWGFKVGNISNGMTDIYHQQLLNLLTLILNDGDIRALFENGGPLDDFTFTGVMLNNGRIITQGDLIAIIEQVLSSKIIIDNYIVE